MKKLLFFLTTLTLLSLAWGGAVKAQQTLTVYDQGGDNSNSYVPMYGGYFDENTKTEFVIPAAQLEAMNGGTITSMKFYISSVSGTYSWASTQTVFLKEVESDQLSAYSGTDGATIVYTGQFTAPESTETEFEINFQTPYEYHGGNLLVGIYNSAGGSSHYRFVYWYGENVNGASGSGNSSSSMAYVSFSQKNFIPMTTFTYEAPAGCVEPASINVTALTSSSISISWPAGNANSWNVYLNGTITGDSPVSLNSYTFENLTEDEYYTIGVSAACGSEESDVTTTTVFLCVPAPYSVDGSGITNVTFGGMEDVLSMTQSPYYYDHSNQIGAASPGGTVNMSIVYATNYGYHTWVWVDWNQDHTFSDEECVYTSIETISSGPLELSFDVPYTIASGYYRMRIQGADDAGKKDPCYKENYSYLVDYTLHIGEAFVCLAPSDLTATNVTHEGATLTWSNPNEGGSYIIKKVVGDEETVIEDNYTSTSYPITGLDPQTNYTYRIYIKCSDSDVSDYAEVSFSTTAPATAVGDYWSDDFEGTSCEWELINGNQTNAWVWGTATNNGGTHSLYISKDGGSTNTYSGASTKVFAAKLLNFTDSKYTFEYDWNCYGEKNWDFLRVALVPASETLTAGEDYSTIGSSGSNSLPTGWIALDEGGQLNESTSWQNKSVAINVAAGNYYLVLAWRNDVSAYDPPAAVDNVSITKVACEYLVEGVQVINSTVTTTTANVLWDASEATAWQVQTKAGDGEWTTLASSDVDFSLSGVKEIAYLRNLTPGTEYQVRVRANCGNEQYGTWSEVVSFTTECAPRAVTNDNKFTANFDDMTGTTYTTVNILPFCWNYINTCSHATYNVYPYVYWSSSESNSGTNHLRFFSLASADNSYLIPKPQYAILPPMQDVSNLRIKFYARAYNIGTDYDATFKVGVLTNPNDASTFTEIATYTPATTTYELYTIPFNTYSGNGNYIAIMIDAAEVPASGDFHRMLFVDDIIVEPTPTCVEPTGVTVAVDGPNSATISWTDGGNTGTPTYIIKMGDTELDGSTTPAVSIEGTTATLTGLTADHNYAAGDFTISTKCSETESSEPVNVYAFNTPCDAQPITYTMGFEAAESGKFDCWEVISGDITIKSGTAHESSYRLDFRGSNSNMIALPQFTEPTNTLRVEFWTRPEDKTYANCGKFAVGYLTDLSDASTFVPVKIYNYNDWSSNTYEKKTVDFNEVPVGVNIALRQYDCATNYYWYVDDITVMPIPECVVPTNLRTVTVAHDGATVKWAANLEESWNLKYHAQGENQWIEVNGLQDSTYTFTELNAETDYEWQVQAACGANLTSEWSSLGTFTTEAEPQVTCHEWQLVTSANDLQDGDVVYIVYENATNNTYKELNGVNTDNIGVAEDYIGTPVGLYPLTLVSRDNGWAFKNGSDYLSYSGYSNLLYTSTTLNDNSTWTVTFNNGIPTITNVAVASREIQYNKQQPRFACYTGTQQSISLYKHIDNRRLATKDTTVAHALPFTFTMAGQPDTIITSYGEFNLSYVIEADPVNCDSVLNVHLTVNEPMFTVTLEAGAGTIALPTPLTGNSTHPVGLANLVPELDNNCTEWTFAGWSSAAVAETNDAPDFVTTISPTSDTTLYAVYVKSEGGSGDAIWQKANTIAIGDQMVLVYETGKYELSGISTTSTKYGERVSYSVAPTGVYPLTVVAGTAAASYSLKTSDDNYLTWTSGNSLNKASSVTDNSSWSISFDNDGNADIANISQDTRKIRYNTSSPRFACYEGGQSAIQLYKLSNPVVNTYNSNPVCDVNYNITLIQPADGSISSDPELTASAGAVVTLTATPHAGYTFESWEVRNLATDGTVEVTNDQFTMPAANVEVHASFTAIEYTVTATANPAAGGTITGAGTYSYEGAASLTASANNGYEFVNWTNEQGAVVCTTATYNFIVTRDSALTANFALKEYTITMSVVTGGTLSHNLPANVATMGTEVTLIATPDEGFQFDGDWTVQNTSASSPVTVENNKFTMPAGNVTVTGYFSPITYTVSAVISPDNAGSVSGTGSYNHGAEAQLRATPASGYEFVNWTNAQGAVVSTDADYNFIVNRDSALTANFELKEYTITMSVVSGGTLSHNLPANVATMGTEVTLIATPDEGYQFDGDWTVQNTSASSPVTVENNKFTMPAGNVTVTGYFSYITYTVSAVVSPANAGSVTGTGSFNHGAEVQLTANPATGYVFVNWTNAQGAVVCTTATYNFNVTSDSALTANFALKEYTITYMDGNTELDVDTFAFGADVTAIADPEKECKEFAGWNETLPATMPANNIVLYAQWNDLYYNITASADPVNGGSVTFNPEPEVGTTAANSGYLCNTPVTLTATPAQGYTFTGWSVNGQIVSADAEYDIIATQNSTLVATYAPNKYNITWELNGGTYTGQAQLPTTYTYGEAYTLPTANELNKDNHTFGGWYDNAQFTGNPITEISTTAMGDTAFYAMWTTDAFAITLIQPSNGTISSDPAQTAAVGAQVILTATPNEGYSFDAWEVRNTTTGQTVDVANNQFIMPAGNVEVHASFTLNSYDVIATVNPVDGGTITGAGTFSHGGVATLTATANEGYRFINWTSNQTEISTETSVAITVTSDTNLVANFQALEKVATPTFTPVAGTYTEPKTVTIACATPGAVIYYTTDGTEPTANSTQYTAGFELNANTTVKAIAMKDGNDWLPSDVATAEYIFNFPLYTVTFIPGTNGTVTKDTMMGNAFTHPVDFTNNSAVPAADCQTLGWSFVGWSTAAVQETTTAPITLVTSPYSPTDNITLYAVYQQDNNAAVSSSVDFSTMGYSNQTAVTTVDINNTTTATFAKANGSTAPTYYTSGTAVRCYAKNTITISSQSAMTGITFTFGSDDGQNAITADEGAYSNGVWTGNATSVTFTIGGANGNRRIATITVNQGGTVTTYNSDPDCIITYPIELATVQNGTIGADKTEAAEGETVTLNATPATGYHFGRWNVTKTATTSVENVTVTNNTFEMPASAVTVSADFWIDTLIILTTPNPANGGTVTGEDEYEYGTQVTLTATPANDYYFTGWTSNGTQVSTDATFTFTATQDSDLVANFEAKQLVATPTFSPAAGTYTEPKTVTISCTTQGATIYYTTDGTEPTANSTQYTDGFTLNANTTVKAIAVKDGEQWLPSEVATAAYTFNFPTYTVTFNPGNNGTVPEATMTGNQFTEPVDFTNNVPSPAATCTDWTFAGWSTAEVTETTTEPTFVTSPYNPSADITLYAVYQKTEQGTGAATPARYVKVTSAPNDWSGDYLIVCEDAWVAFNGSSSNLSANDNIIDNVDINNGVIASTSTTDAAKFTIASMTNGYSIKSASGKYIGNASNSNALTASDNALSNTLSMSDGNCNIVSSGGAYLRYNGSGNNSLFRYYKSSSYTNQMAIQLYKYEPATAATVTTYNTNPVCSYMVYVDGNMQNGMVTVDPATATTEGAAIGSTVTLTATPATGYHFGRWNVTSLGTSTVESIEISANNTFVMPTNDVNVSADFWIDTLTIDVVAVPTVGGDVTGAGEYEYGTAVTLTATPSTYYIFTNWTVNDQPVSTDATITFNATQDSTFKANFTHMEKVASLVVDPVGGNFTSEDNVTITITCATPNSTIYYTLDGTDPVVPGGRNVTGTQVYSGPINITSTTTLKAVAAATDMINSDTVTETYRIVPMRYVNAWNTLNGTVSYDPAKDTAGATINVNAVANDGYHFASWHVFDFNGTDVTVTNNTFTMPDTNVYVDAIFEPDTFTVTFVLNDGHFVNGYTPISRYWYKQQDANLPTAADMEYEGHSFDGWYENANFEGNSWTSVPDTAKSNKTYYAKWNVNSYDLTINYVDANGQTLAPAHTETLQYGASYNVSTPDVATYMPDQTVVSGNMGTAAVTVNVIYTQIVMNAVDNQTVCTGSTTTAVEFSLPTTLTQTFPNMEVMFEKSIDNTSIGIADETYGNIAAFTAVNAGTEPVVTTITVTPLCTLNNHAVRGVPQTFTITVTPKHTSEFSETVCDNYYWATADTTIVDEGSHDYVHVFANQYGCDSTVTLHLTLYKTPTSLTTTVTPNTSCVETAPNGAIAITAPTGDFEYSINGTDWQTTTEFANLAANDYSVYVRPLNSECAYTENVTVTDNVERPLSTPSVSKAFYCTDEDVTLSSTGSSTGSEFAYAWSGPNGFTSTETSPVLANPLTSAQSGTYVLAVTNTVTNCVTEASVDVVVNTPTTSDYLFTITTHGDAYANIDLNETTVTPVFATPEVHHFQDGANVNYTVVNNAAATYDAVGDYTITWTATDECGNEVTTTQVLHVTQNTCPVAADVDGNTYPAVQLAGKCWMAKNLRTTKYSDGRAVNNLMVYENIMYPNTTANLDRYGYLYDWTSAMDAENGLVLDANNNIQGICPTGWHMPNGEDFMNIAGTSTVTDMFDLRYNHYWLDGGGNNSTDYSLLPGGCYNENAGRYENLIGNAYLWGVNTANPTQPRVYWADCKCYMWQVNDVTGGMGYSVRCIKD